MDHHHHQQQQHHNIDNYHVMSHNNIGVESKKSKKSKSNKNKKRFSDEQIKSLESIFESETKLEPRKKVQLARELGLQPRQIAIWFQNRRARWKSKQIEQEYKVLKASYDHLASQFEFLVKEKQSLVIQLQKLSELLEKRQESERNKKDLEGKCIEREAMLSSKTKPIVVSEELEKRGLSSQDHHHMMIRSKNNINGSEDHVLNTDCSLGSLEKMCNFESTSGGLIDQPSGNLHWWNIWT